VRYLDALSKAPSIAKTLREFNEGAFHVLVPEMDRFSAGVSLSTATDVIFSTPCLDINTELQALGPVRRLGFAGQSVRLHRFVASNFEEERQLPRKNTDELARLVTAPREDETPSADQAAGPARLESQASSAPESYSSKRQRQQ